MHKPAYLILSALCGVLCLAQQNTPLQLTPGMNLERAIGPSEEHSYIARLESGAAIIAQADQMGADVVIDIFDPNGKQVKRLDSPNGTQGPEPIDFTALQSGTFKFVVHILDTNAKPGKYVMKVEQIIDPSENALRLAKQSIPLQAIYDLWKASLTDPTIVDRFLADRVGKTPMFDATPINDTEMRVTYV